MKSLYDKKEVPKFTLLIVEDHEALRRLLNERLGMIFAGCRRPDAANGEGAVSVALARQSDVVLRDIGLPIMNRIAPPFEGTATEPNDAARTAARIKEMVGPLTVDER